MNLRPANCAALLTALYLLGACASTKPDLADDPSAGLDFPRKQEGSAGGEGSEHDPAGTGSTHASHDPAPPDLAETDEPTEPGPEPATGGEADTAP